MAAFYAIGQVAAVSPPVRRLGFWSFAGPVLAGNLSAAAVVWLTRKVTADPRAAIFTGISAFWLVGGLSWVAVTRNHAKLTSS